MSKENFKNFAKIHPELASFVTTGKTSWQKLYELYDIYGEDSTVWSDYFSKKQSPSINKQESQETTINDFVSTIKNIDLKSVQKGINNIQKTIGLLQDMGLGASSNVELPYEPRPMYKYFED